MGAKVTFKEKISQKSIAFHNRQLMFMDEHPEFNPAPFCRVAVDEQIKIIDPVYLSEEN